MNAKVKIALALTLLTCVLLYVAFLGFTTTWQYYLLVDECAAQADQRVSNVVRRSSIVMARY